MITCLVSTNCVLAVNSEIYQYLPTSEEISYVTLLILQIDSVPQNVRPCRMYSSTVPSSGSWIKCQNEN